MGQSFERILIRGGYSHFSETRVRNAAERIGYTLSADGGGVPFRICVLNDSMDWLLLDSPLLEGKASDRFISAVSECFKEPVLKISCADSDFALLTLNASGGVTTACINRPYEGIELPEPDPSLWVAACRKKWKCKESQFEELFGSGYTFAETGIRRLAELLHIPEQAFMDEVPEQQLYVREYRIVPKDEAGSAPVPLTLAERLGAYICAEYGQRLTELGFRRYNNDPLRWHRVFGEDGKELIASIVFTVKHDYEIDILFGLQPICCPLVLSDRYYPMHDAPSYWLEAQYELKKHTGHDPRWSMKDGVSFHDNLNAPEKIDSYMNELILPAFAKVTDIRSCRGFTREYHKYWQVFSETGRICRSFAYRLFVEAILDGDESEAGSFAQRLIENSFDLPEYVPSLIMLDDLPRLFIDGGIPACLPELYRVRDLNLKKLKKVL